MKAKGTKRNGSMKYAILLSGLLFTTCTCMSDVKAEQFHRSEGSSTIVNDIDEDNQVPIKNEDKEKNEKTSKSNEKDKEDSIEFLDGVIKSVKKREFRVLKAETKESCDGNTEIACLNKDGDPITVHYTKKTKFILCSSSDGGITTKEKATSSKSLKKDKGVLIEGTWIDKDFDATKVTIYKFN